MRRRTGYGGSGRWGTGGGGEEQEDGRETGDGRMERGEKIGEKGGREKRIFLHAQRREEGDKGREGGGKEGEGERPMVQPTGFSLHPPFAVPLFYIIIYSQFE